MGADGRAPRDTVEWLRVEASIRTARWFGVAFAVFQITVFPADGVPGHVRPVGYLLAGLLAATNVLVGLALRRVRTSRGARRLAWASLLADAALVSAYVWLYAFDPNSSLYLLFFVLPAHAALKFQATGALVAWAACTLTYVGRELWAADRYGSQPEPTSITFRMGVLLIVSLLVGMFARKLADRSDELEAALRELEEQERWRQGLIDMLAHDLRSPVGNATSTLMLLRDRIDRLSDDDVRTLAGSAVAQNERALRLTDDLLDLARSQQGRLELQLADVEVEPLLARVVPTLPVASGDVTLVVEPGLRARVDAARLEQVVANLVGNAAKHGAVPIEVAARAVDGDVLELRVTDAGSGVPSDVQEGLFSPFAGRTGTGSVGLGLWVVRTLAAAHGGDATYEPGPPPAFVVRIPGAARSVPGGAGATT